MLVLFYKKEKKHLMMEIGKYFCSSNSRDLCDNSKDDTDRNKVKEATLSSNYSDHNVFEDDLDSSTCRGILFGCLKIHSPKLTKHTETRIP